MNSCFLSFKYYFTYISNYVCNDYDHRSAFYVGVPSTQYAIQAVALCDLRWILFLKEQVSALCIFSIQFKELSQISLCFTPGRMLLPFTFKIYKKKCVPMLYLHYLIYVLMFQRCILIRLYYFSLKRVNNGKCITAVRDI